MGIIEKSYEIEGLLPTLMHSSQTADPMNPYSKMLKKITNKKKKTYEDHLEIAHISFLASFYVNEDRNVYWPCDNIKAMITRAAKKSREGTVCKESIIVTSTEFIYDGPKTPDELWGSGDLYNSKYISHVIGVIGGKKIMVTRPIFKQWKLKFTVSIDDLLINDDILDNWIKVAGRQIGLGDWRPQNGLFRLVSSKIINI